MHATQVLDTYLKNHCQGIHLKRMKALITTTMALMRGRKLSVTGLGSCHAVRSENQTQYHAYLKGSEVPPIKRTV